MNDTSRDAQDSGAFDDEVVVIGSGFGGSVAALRLSLIHISEPRDS